MAPRRTSRIRPPPRLGDGRSVGGPPTLLGKQLRRRKGFLPACQLLWALLTTVTVTVPLVPLGLAQQASPLQGQGVSPRTLLPLLLLLFLDCASHHALAQQASPLQGQGVSPCLSGYTSLCKLPVYTRVELQRLMHIDEREYQFHAVVNVHQSWADPRAESTFRLIDSKDVLKQAEGRPDAYQGIRNCIAVAKRGRKGGNPNPSPSSPGSLEDTDSGLDLAIPACQAVVPPPLACRKWCIMDGLTTDNPFRCCDLVWLPDIYLSNLIDITQDRWVYDHIEYLKDPVTGQSFVHRTTRVQGRFYTPLMFRDFPFDDQKLTMFFDARIEGMDALGFGIVPSATFRRLNADMAHGPGSSLTLKRLVVNELAGWNITDITFKCSRLLDLLNETTGTTDGSSSSSSSSSDPSSDPTAGGGSDDAAAGRLWQQTQRSDPNDPFWANADDAAARFDEFRKLFATCALTVQVSRLSSTLTAQSILPVAFVGCMAFVVFFSAPDLLDLRVGTEISLFLALTAVQFVFASVMPVTSYLTAFDIFILLTYSTLVVIVLESLLVYYVATRELSAGKRTKGGSKGGVDSSSVGAWGSVSIDTIARCPDGQGPSIIRMPSAFQPIGAEAPLVVVGEKNEGGAFPLTRPSPGEFLAQSSLNGSLRAPEEPVNLLESTHSAEGLHQGEQVAGRVSEESTGGGVTGRDGQEGKGVPQPPGAPEVQAWDPPGKGVLQPPGDSWRRALGRLRRPGPFSDIGQAVHQTQSRLAQDSGLSYRVARRIDMASGAVLFCVYVLLSVLNFTIGFH